MARNYKKEAAWAKDKYKRINVMSEQYKYRAGKIFRNTF